MDAEADGGGGAVEAAAKAPDSRAPPCTQRAGHRAPEDFSQALKSNGTCTAGFQTCFGPVIPSFLPLSPFWNELRLWEMLRWGGCILKVGPK